MASNKANNRANNKAKSKTSRRKKIINLHTHLSQSLTLVQKDCIT